MGKTRNEFTQRESRRDLTRFWQTIRRTAQLSLSAGWLSWSKMSPCSRACQRGHFLPTKRATGEKRSPDQREKISDEELFRYRDGLILWLEPFWPWMTDRLVAARTVAEIAAILEAVAPEPDSRAGWQNRILQNAVVLCEFLWDERLQEDRLPRATVDRCPHSALG